MLVVSSVQHNFVYLYLLLAVARCDVNILYFVNLNVIMPVDGLQANDCYSMSMPFEYQYSMQFIMLLNLTCPLQTATIATTVTVF